jgi:hypothetical protein
LIELQGAMGPVDYLLVEWTDRQPSGGAVPHLVDLVDRGLIRVLDLAFIAKGEDGSVAMIEIADLGGEVAEFAVFEGAASGLLDEGDLAQLKELGDLKAQGILTEEEFAAQKAKLLAG